MCIWFEYIFLVPPLLLAPCVFDVFVCAMRSFCCPVACPSSASSSAPFVGRQWTGRQAAGRATRRRAKHASAGSAPPPTSPTPPPTTRYEFDPPTTPTPTAHPSTSGDDTQQNDTNKRKHGIEEIDSRRAVS